MKGVFGKLAVVAVALTFGLVAVPSAQAKTVRYSGKTSQGTKVHMKTNAQGKLKRFVIAFNPVCDRGVLEGGEVFYPPFLRANANGFHDGGKVVNDLGGGVTAKSRGSVTGTRVSDEKFEGSFKWKVLYYEDGEKFNACRINEISWSVRR